MDETLLQQVWKLMREWRRCDYCSLKELTHPLIFEVERIVKVMVITEGPNRLETNNFIASVANHPTYTYLYTLFGGKFNPMGSTATVYWTHLRKCFLKGKNGDPLIDNTDKVEENASRICRENYLIDEIRAVQPKLVVAVGESVKNFLAKVSTKNGDKLKGKLKEVLRKQPDGIVGSI